MPVRRMSGEEEFFDAVTGESGGRQTSNCSLECVCVVCVQGLQLASEWGYVCMCHVQ